VSLGLALIDLVIQWAEENSNLYDKEISIYLFEFLDSLASSTWIWDSGKRGLVSRQAVAVLVVVGWVNSTKTDWVNSLAPSFCTPWWCVPSTWHVLWLACLREERRLSYYPQSNNHDTRIGLGKGSSETAATADHAMTAQGLGFCSAHLS
jgi:hypothetical protein